MTRRPMAFEPLTPDRRRRPDPGPPPRSCRAGPRRARLPRRLAGRGRRRRRVHEGRRLLELQEQRGSVPGPSRVTPRPRDGGASRNLDASDLPPESRLEDFVALYTAELGSYQAIGPRSIWSSASTRCGTQGHAARLVQLNDAIVESVAEIIESERTDGASTRTSLRSTWR